MSRLSIFLFVLLGVVAANCAAQRSIPPLERVTDYRPVGENRIWTFERQDSVVGTLSSAILREDEVDDSDAVVIAQSLTLDYSKIGDSLKLTSSGDHYISEHGTYLGDELTISVNGREGELNLRRRGNQLSGTMKSGSSEDRIERELKDNVKVINANFYDQLEIYLAMRGVTVGEIVTDTLFSSDILLPTVLKYSVRDFRLEGLYNKVTDSVFLIIMEQPQELFLYLTPDRRLVRIDNRGIRQRVYLDVVSGGKEPAKRSSPTMPSLPKMPFKVMVLTTLPHFGFYLLFGFLSLLFFAYAHLKRGVVWLGLLAGIVAFIPVYYLQDSIQVWVVRTLFIPKVSGGGSPFFWAVFPALLIGLIQELLKFGAIQTMIHVRGIKGKLLPILGAAVGCGLAIAEATTVTASLGIMPLFGSNLAERAFQIILHTAAGALLGIGIVQGRAGTICALVVTIIANSLIRYLPVFAQVKKADVELLYILFGFVSVALLAWAWLQGKKLSERSLTEGE